MGGTFTVGQVKTRPGIYTRYENAGSAEPAGAINGIGGAIFSAKWGPLNTPIELSSVAEGLSRFYSELSVGIIEKMFAGGCSKVIAVRAGSGGTAAALTLEDTTGTPVDVVTITAKYVGSRAFSVTIRDSLTNSLMRDCIIYSGTAEMERHEFLKGSSGIGEPAQLVAAMASSENFTAAKLADGSKILATIAQTAMTAGTEPTVTVTEYGTALTAIEAAVWNVLCVGTTDTTIHALIQPFLARIYAAGSFPMACLSEAKSIAFATRQSNGTAFNDEKIVYVLNSGLDSSDNAVEGYLLAALIGGMIAAAPSSSSLTHSPVPGLASLNEALTNSQIENALAAGCLVLSLSAGGKVWIESGINTLTTLSGDQDAGWKKIRRTKTRHELMSRVVATTDELVGKVDNDEDGRAAFIAAAQGVINEMVNEKKIRSGSTVIEDPENPAAGDSAWFIIAVDDIDSIEKAYLGFKFRFTPDA